MEALLQDAREAAAPGPARHQRHSQPSRDETAKEASKSELHRFFHGSGTTLGVFYPTHYIFAAFPSYQAARNAADKLGEVGFDKDEVVAVTSAETVRFFNEFRADVSLWGRLMSAISRFFGTEEVLPISIFADLTRARVSSPYIVRGKRKPSASAICSNHSSLCLCSCSCQAVSGAYMPENRPDPRATIRFKASEATFRACELHARRLFPREGSTASRRHSVPGSYSPDRSQGVRTVHG